MFPSGCRHCSVDVKKGRARNGSYFLGLKIDPDADREPFLITPKKHFVFLASITDATAPVERSQETSLVSNLL